MWKKGIKKKKVIIYQSMYLQVVPAPNVTCEQINLVLTALSEQTLGCSECPGICMPSLI